MSHIFLDRRGTLGYDSLTSRTGFLWACTGFDGGFEVEEAIHGPDRVITGTINLTDNNTVAVAA